MKISDTPPPLPRRVSKPSIRDDQALNECFQNSVKMHRATFDDVYTKAWFDDSRLPVFPQSIRKRGKDVQLFNVSTYQRSIFSDNFGSFNRKSDSWKPENLNKPITKGEKFKITELSVPKEFWETTLLMFSLRQRRTVCRQTQGSCLRTMAWRDAIQPEAMACLSMQEVIPQFMFIFFMNQSEKKKIFPRQRSLRWIYVRNQKE